MTTQYLKKNFFNSTTLLTIAICGIVCTNSIAADAQKQSVQNPCFSTPQIQSINLQINSSSNKQAIGMLGQADTLHVEFDELFADLRTLYFTVQHHSPQWHPDDLMLLEYSSLMPKEYDGFTSAQSQGTLVDYYHYRLSLPLQSLKLSGNYTISIYSADNDELLLRQPFILCEQIAGIKSCVTKNISDKTQDVTLEVAYPNLKVINPINNISVCVWQNENLQTTKFFSTPQQINGDALKFLKPVTFCGGNEFHFADTRSLKGQVLMPGSRIIFDDAQGIYASFFAPVKRPFGYAFHKDWNGNFYVYNYDMVNFPANTSADYSIATFCFQPSDAEDRDRRLFVNTKAFSCFASDDAPTQLIYDANLNIFTCTLWLKQSLSAYQIIELLPDGTLTTENTEGAYADTENQYTIGVYYLSEQLGTYRLIGIRQHNTLTTTNSFIM